MGTSAHAVSMLPEKQHGALPGVRVFPLSGAVRRGEPQMVLVVVEPGAKIPLHAHDGDAVMTITAGSARVLSEDDPEGERTEVGPGACVFFAATKLHGFIAGTLGFSFLSRNEGIVDSDPANWDMQFAAA